MQTIIDSITYKGYESHIAINYVMIVLTLLPFLSDYDDSRRWLTCLTFITSIQVLLWFIMNVIGISLIWCAMAGFLGREYCIGKYNDGSTIWIFCNIVLVVLYYAMFENIETTIAHIIAIMIGYSISKTTELS
jgi:hypothetical protein